MSARHAIFLSLLALVGCHRQGPSGTEVVDGSVSTEVMDGSVSTEVVDDAAAIPRLMDLAEHGEPARAEIDSGAVHSYLIDLEADDFLHLIVEQEGIDVAVTLVEPVGVPQIAVDSPNGREGPEHVWMLAAVAGTFRVEISAGADVIPGRYGVRIASLRPATAADRRTAQAARGLQSARGLRGTDLDAAAVAFDRLLPIWQEGGEPRGEALTHEYLGLIYGRLKETARARDHYREVLAVHRTLEDRREMARLWTRIADSHRLAHEYPAALVAFQRALELWEATDELTAKIYNNAALCAKRMGRARQALELYDKALSRWRGLGRRGRSREATTRHNLGELYYFLGDEARARAHFEGALELRREVGDPRRIASTLTSLGKVEAKLPDLTGRAVQRLTEALELRRNVGDGKGEAVTLTNLGNVSLRHGDIEKAEESYRLASALFTERAEPYDEAFVRINLGQVHQARGRVADALREYEAARATFSEMGVPRGEAAALFGMAKSERHRGRLDSAESRVSEAIDLVERLRATAGGEMQRMTYLASKQNHYDFLIDLLMERHRRDPTKGHAARALTVAERRRARNLLELLREPAGDPPNHDLAVTDSVPPVPTLDLESIQGLLDPETLVLAFALGEERSFLWAVRDEGVTVHELPEREQIEGLAENVHRLMRRSHLEENRLQATLMAASLGRWLLGPVLPHLNVRRIVVLAEGALHYVPFAALPVPIDPETPGWEPLIESHEVLALPSASVLALLRRERAQRLVSRTVAVFADPVFSRDDPRLSELALDPLTHSLSESSFSRLPFTQDEADSILSRVPEDGRWVALGFKANRAEALSGSLRQYRIVHFATHARVHPKRPELSKIALSRFDAEGRERESFLTEKEISGLELAADLVVLSACETALGAKIRGEGLVGLTQAFFRAGTPRLLVSLWRVDDRATAVLMDRFYGHLLDDGLPPAAALRRAQRWMRANGWETPFHWAGFVLQGDWR